MMRVRRVSCTGTPRPAAAAAAAWSAPGVRQQDLAESLEILDALAGSQHDRLQGIVGYVDGQAGLLAQPVIYAAQQRAATGQCDSPVHDITGEFGRALVQCGPDGVDDHVERLFDGAANLLRGYLDGLRQAADQVPATDFDLRLSRCGKRRADRDLDVLGRPFAQHERVRLLDEGDDGLVEFVTADADRLRGHYAAKWDNGDLGGPAADIHDHAAHRLV